VEPSPLPIIIPLGPKYSPQDPVVANTTIIAGTTITKGKVCLVAEIPFDK